MGQLIGLYIAFVLMEAVVAIPAYYLFRALAGKRYVEWIALSSVILGLGVMTQRDLHTQAANC